MSGARFIAGIEPLIEGYDGFLLDQFGVLHDGVAPFPGVVAALSRLREQGRAALILSNSGKRSAPNVARLEGLGIPRSLYTGLVSSGEAAWLGLRERTDPLFADLGRRCLLVSRGGDRSAIEGLDLDLVDADTADFVLLAGLDGDAHARARLDGELAIALGRRLPLVCTNPDVVSLEGERRVDGPGRFAQDYAEVGGEVRWVGKPHAAIFRAALERVGVAPDRLVMVGDSLHHDIKGASPFGIDGALVMNGVHEAALEGRRGADLDAALQGLLGDDLPAPRWLLPAFRLDPKD
ncbi:MAG: TIGR01459 family HAD-type hydrolase [Geminicoccaceae bacterium]|nr:TIGR01459 family HAD-type hydrolase [Geminicoccaceae bacterium]